MAQPSVPIYLNSRPLRELFEKLKSGAARRGYYRRKRAEAIAAYGGRCVCCGEEEPAFLTIDHVNHDGKQHRARVGPNVYYDLKRRGWPRDGYALKCMNCNWAERWGNVCPHKSPPSAVPS